MINPLNCATMKTSSHIIAFLVLTSLGWDVSAAENPVAPRHPEIPSAEDARVTNPIDRFLQPYYSEHKIAADNVVSDEVFARRVCLDLTGLLPTPRQLEDFLADKGQVRLVIRGAGQEMAQVVHHQQFFVADRRQ